MVAVDLGSLCGPDLVTWIWFQFLLVVPPWPLWLLEATVDPKRLHWLDSSIRSLPMAAKYPLAPRMTYVEDSSARIGGPPIMAAGVPEVHSVNKQPSYMALLIMNGGAQR